MKYNTTMAVAAADFFALRVRVVVTKLEKTRSGLPCKERNCR